MTSLFYEQGLHLLTNMLQSHITMKLLRINCSSIQHELSQPYWIKETQHFCQTIFLDLSFQYPRIVGCKSVLDALKSQVKTLTNREQLPLIEGLFC